MNERSSFLEVMDVHVRRIIVDDVSASYLMLNLSHKIDKPVHNKFKYYIVIPIANGH
ncbi:MAG: hypothetical protein HRT91_02885 [Piscirickettsiaceae bacterium]|nr:hypothetical protein [Piscirickettsiaceae bacterium]